LTFVLSAPSGGTSAISNEVSKGAWLVLFEVRLALAKLMFSAVPYNPETPVVLSGLHFPPYTATELRPGTALKLVISYICPTSDESTNRQLYSPTRVVLKPPRPGLPSEQYNPTGVQTEFVSRIANVQL